MSSSRRTFLKGAALGSGAVVLAPILQRLQAEADGKPVQAKRFVFVLQSNGFQPWAAQPKGLERSRTGPDRITDVPLADYKLTEDLDPPRATQILGEHYPEAERQALQPLSRRRIRRTRRQQ